MASGKRNKIFSLRKGSVQWNEEDRLAICAQLIKAGYAARIGRSIVQGTKGKTSQYEYYVEYWEETSDEHNS